MLTAGIVAEYNPFHNGHKYLAQQTRKNGATHIIAVMSGAAVQRGDVAVFDKYYRAQCAVQNGVDLVLELPAPFSCASGEVFASSAVQILAGLGKGVVNRLSFGSEFADKERIVKAAVASDEMKNSPHVKQKLSLGKSYPLAVYEAVCEAYSNEIGEVLASPNSTLGVEYARAVSQLCPDMELSPVMRKAVGHHDTQAVQGIASASSVRTMLLADEDASEFLPYDYQQTAKSFLENMQSEVLYRLACADKLALCELLDVSDDLADRIIVVMKKMPCTLDEFFHSCKSKNITMARLRRVVIYLLLGIKKQDILPAPYARVLAFNECGQDILRKCKGSSLPVDTSLKRLENTSDYAKRVSQIEQSAVKLQWFCSNRKNKFVSDYERKINIKN